MYTKTFILDAINRCPELIKMLFIAVIKAEFSALSLQCHMIFQKSLWRNISDYYFKSTWNFMSVF